jgi:DNA-binding CsgD family transcriptional regulator
MMARRRAKPLPERLASIESALAEVDGLSPGQRTSRIRAELFVELAYVSIEAHDLQSGRAAVDSARRAAHEADDQALLLQAASQEGMLDAIAGDVTAGLDRISSAAREAREQGFEDVGVTAYRDAAETALRVMEYRRAAEWVEDGLQYADAIEQSHCAHVLAATGAMVAWADGRWDDAITLGEHELADRGCDRAAGMARWPLGYTALCRGDYELAAVHLRVAETFGDASGALGFRLAAGWGLTQLSVLCGDFEDAIARSDRALESAQTSGDRGWFAPFVVVGTFARISAGRRVEAERWLAAAAEFLEPAEWYARPALEHAAGLLQLSGGSTVAARESLERAARGWDARGRTWELLWARIDLARCLLQSGRHVEAANLIAGVREAATHLGSRPLLERVAELGRLSLRHDAEEAAWHPLTAREFEVARLIATGLTNAEIAAELSVAPRTVGAHVEHILAKLGAARRTEIARWVATVTLTSSGGGRHEDRGAQRGERPPQEGAVLARR